MNNRVVVVACSILVLALIATGIDDQDQKQCTYTFKIKTANKNKKDMTDPATTNPVDVRIGDCTTGIIIQNISSEFVKIDDDDSISSTPFQDGATDSFNVTRECVKSKVCLVYVKLHGEDDWIIEGMKVDIEGHEALSSEIFNFGRKKVSRNAWDGVDTCKCNAGTSEFGDYSKRNINLFPPVGTGDKNR